MLSGAYEHTVDDKCRMVVPARLRQMLGDKFVITRGLNGCLWIFSRSGFTFFSLDANDKCQDHRQ